MNAQAATPDLKATQAVAQILRLAQRSDEIAAFMRDSLSVLIGGVSGDFAATVAAEEGKWTLLAETGARQPLPKEFLADVLDREQADVRDGWAVVPLVAQTRRSETLAVHMPPDRSARSSLPLVRELADTLGCGLASVRRRIHDRCRIQRLETILQIAQQWNQTRDLQPLLVQMAEAATQLLDADRASIFLWDRRAKLLIGRPALGVKGGELRLPDDRGVVGRVVQTGETCRVDATAEPDKFDRQVDKQSGYRTRTLLCVPLRGKSGELFGAFELLNKKNGTFSAEDEAALVELAAHASIALENAQDREQLLSTSRQLTEQAAEQVRMVGKSPKIEALRSVVRRVADTDLAVLILGENGTGKEVVAQSIHYLSKRRDKPFVAVNCAAIPDTLAESELFGHEKGAFTDARDMRQGKFELADSGTLFLDEIGDLSLSGQAKLLRVLEEKVLVRVGGSTPIHTDARVIAATNQDLTEMVRQKRFREDLYFRLNVVTLEIPRLSDRGDDILLLAEHFLADFSRKARRKVPQFTPAARERLLRHPWPGNVRELRNLMERLAYLTAEDTIDASDLAFILSPRRGQEAAVFVDRPLSDATAEFQVQYIKRAIEQSGGNVSQAAEKLGLHRSNLYRKMRQLDMNVPD